MCEHRWCWGVSMIRRGLFFEYNEVDIGFFGVAADVYKLIRLDEYGVDSIKIWNLFHGTFSKFLVYFTDLSEYVGYLLIASAIMTNYLYFSNWHGFRLLHFTQACMTVSSYNSNLMKMKEDNDGKDTEVY